MRAEKPVRVAIITSNYWPERTGIGQVTTEFAEYLAAEGIDVRVATAMPYYPEWKIHAEYRHFIWRSERRNGVLVRRAAHFASPKPTTFGRILHEATLCILSLPNIFAVLWSAKTVFVVSPDLSHAFVGCIVSRLMGVPINLVVQDVMPDAAIEAGMLRNPIVVAISRFFAYANYSLAQTVYTLSDGMKRRIARLAGGVEKLATLANTIDAQELAPSGPLGKPFRDRFVPEGTFAVVHSGNMGEKQDLPLLLRTARRLLTRSDIHFYVFGDGAVRLNFLRTMEEWQLTNVSHFPLQERQLLPHMLFGADVCLVSQVDSIVDVVVPSKLLTCMGASSMIIAACSPDSETALLLRMSNGGIVVGAGDDEALARVILEIREGLTETSEYRANARLFAVTHFSRNNVYGPLARSLKSG